MEDYTSTILLPEQPTQKDIVNGKWVVVKFASKKKVSHFIGHIEEVISCDKITVKYVKMTKPVTYTFVWPEVEDISAITSEEIVGVLKEPKVLRRGILTFEEHLTSLL